jgi:hypothetical protein
MKIIELFCGTKSISNEAIKQGHKCFTIDISPKFNPDLCCDILDLNQNHIPSEFKNPDMLWASPPCTTFSVASMGHHWTGGKGAYIPNTDEARTGVMIMRATVNAITWINPKKWFIENPRGLMRKLIFITSHHVRHTVTYCQYGDKRMKPTDIWTNCYLWNPRTPCKNGDMCHESAPRGSKTGTQGINGAKDRSRIPNQLCQEIISTCHQEICRVEVK